MMSICSCCYNRIKHTNKIKVGHWWGNESFLSVVCSDECKDNLWKMLQDGTWITHKPIAIFKV